MWLQTLVTVLKLVLLAMNAKYVGLQVYNNTTVIMLTCRNIGGAEV